MQYETCATNATDERDTRSSAVNDHHEMFGRTVQDGVDLFLLPNAQGATTSNRLLQVKRLEPKLVVR